MTDSRIKLISAGTATRSRLTKRAAVAVGWSTLGLIASNVLRLCGSLITTRLLAPDLYGVVALAVTFIVALNMFSDLGFRQSVVQQEANPGKNAFETIWVLQIARGGFIAFFILVAAALVYYLRGKGAIAENSVYGHPDFTIALVILSITPVLSGFESLRIYYASRELNLKRLTMIDLIAQLAALLFTVAWAFWSADIFAVTLGIVLSSVIRCALSHWWLTGRSDAFGWSAEQARKILNFSKWLLVSSMLGFVASHGDRLLLAGLLGADDFGVFTVAGLLFGAIYELGSRVISYVMYPALSEIYRNDSNDFSASFFSFRLVFDCGVAGLAGLFIIFSPTLVDLLYDQRYTEAGAVMQVLVVVLIFQWTSAANYVFMIIGKPWILTWCSSIHFAGVLIFVPYLAQRHGLMGAAWAFVLARAVTVPYVYVQLIKAGLFRFRNEAFPLLALVGGALIGMFFVQLLSFFR